MRNKYNSSEIPPKSKPVSPIVHHNKSTSLLVAAPARKRQFSPVQQRQRRQGQAERQVTLQPGATPGKKENVTVGGFTPFRAPRRIVRVCISSQSALVGPAPPGRAAPVAAEGTAKGSGAGASRTGLSWPPAPRLSSSLRSGCRERMRVKKPL